MSSNDMSVVKVRKLKKCVQKRNKHKDTNINEILISEMSNGVDAIYPKQKNRKRKLNNTTILHDSENKKHKVLKSLKKAQDEHDSPNKDLPTQTLKRKKNIDVDKKETESNTNGTQTDAVNIKEAKKLSKRQLKREKAEKREIEKKKASRLKITEKALNYVSKWKYSRNEWKFEKLKQIWLMDNLLDENLIPDTIFPIVLEYFEGCKGIAREQLLKKGMNVIQKVEENEEKKSEIIESVAYQRARQLLQALPTES